MTTQKEMYGDLCHYSETASKCGHFLNRRISIQAHSSNYVIQIELHAHSSNYVIEIELLQTTGTFF
jgi:hypothetical protein